MLLALLACTWVSDADHASRLDPDGDGVPWPEDCADSDPEVGVATLGGVVVARPRPYAGETLELWGWEGTETVGWAPLQSLPPIPGGLAVKDFDGDRVPDVVAAEAEALSVWKGSFDEECAFELSQGGSTPVEGSLAAVGDLDGDGDLDLLMVLDMAGDRWFSLMNDGNGAFSPTVEFNTGLETTAYSHAATNTMADLTGDGCADMVWAAWDSGGASPARLRLAEGSCDGRLGNPQKLPSTEYPVEQGAIADLDGDGNADVVWAPDDDGDPGRIWLMRGDGAGGLSDAEEIHDTCPEDESGSDSCRGSSQVGDADGDGDADVIVSWSEGDDLDQRQATLLLQTDGALEPWPTPLPIPNLDVYLP